MIDLHMHSIFSDGELIPAELTRRAEAMGHSAIAITDHVDQSNVEFVTAGIVRFCAEDRHSITVLPGVEITHVTPGKIAEVAKRARAAGAKIIVVHGETIVEPVEPGTNEAAIDAGVTILAHPGLISDAAAKKAAAAGVFLEISGRAGHSFSNGHVVRAALGAGAKMVFNTDSHSPQNLMGRDMALKVILSAGLAKDQAEEVFNNSRHLVEGLR